MNKKNLELLGLEEGASAADIQAAYESLRAKYMEDRFLDGEAGNNAAKMLTKIDVAYQELLNELNEDATASDGGYSFEKVEELLKAGNVDEAQRVLDGFNERTAQWHYLQSVVFYRKHWMNESKKQLEIAIRLDPDNQKYKEKYRILLDNINAQHGPDQQNGAPQGERTRYEGQTMNDPGQDQMGGNFCASCLDCCSTYLCINCLCNSCCR